MAQYDERLDDACHARAVKRGQARFTVVEQDRSAPATVCEWIKQNIETAPASKLREALEFCLRARDFKDRKNAD
jgi:hypothetical protein